MKLYRIVRTLEYIGPKEIIDKTLAASHITSTPFQVGLLTITETSISPYEEFNEPTTHTTNVDRAIAASERSTGGR